jgi:hypothetical protein
VVVMAVVMTVVMIRVTPRTELVVSVAVVVVALVEQCLMLVVVAREEDTWDSGCEGHLG